MNNSTLDENQISIQTLLEALLFIAPVSVTTAQLASVLGVTNQKIETALNELDEAYKNPELKRGLRLQRLHGRVQLTTIPDASPIIEHFLGLDTTSRLSRAALETLAVIAYREPVTRPQIDAIRGVNSDAVLKTLLNKGLIQDTGRAELPGKPILYGVTSEFLQHFGINSLAELPPLDEINLSDEKLTTDIDHNEILSNS